jgi:hypothetical protein
VAEHESQEFAGVPVAGDVALWLCEGSEEPAEVVLVGPYGDVDLIAAEEGDGGADAVNGRAVGEVALEIETETLLGSAADGDDDVLGAEAVEEIEQRGIVDGCAAVHGCHVDVVFGDGDSLPCEPIQIAFGADGAGHDPEGVARLADIGFKEKFTQVFEAGEALDRDRLQTVPDENHEGGVGDGEVGVEERFAVVEILVEVFERRGGRNDEEAAVGSHDFYGFLCGAVKEVDAEDAVMSRGSCCRHEEICSSLILFDTRTRNIRQFSRRHLITTLGRLERMNPLVNE